MDSLLHGSLTDKKSKITMDTFKKTDEQLSQEAKKNMNQMENMVENNLFSGEQEERQQEHGDYLHGHIMVSVQKQVTEANSMVKLNIEKYSQATLTEEEKKEKDKKLKSKKKDKKVLVNRPAKAASWKDFGKEDALVELLQKDNNKFVDNCGVREINALEKRQSKFKKYLNGDDKAYEKTLNNAVKCVKEGKRGKWKEQLKNDMAHGMMPFLKQYKSGWFGRKYTLDGRRIKTKKGELSPDEYNKKLIESLTLETRKPSKENGVDIDNKTLEANRAKKGEMLGMITKELLDYKLDVNKLTDEYLADHIIEVQEYADKLIGFQHLLRDNKWYFCGNDKDSLDKAEDMTFMHLIETRIIRRGRILNDFLEAHYRSHGVTRTYYDAQGSDTSKLDGNAKLKYHDRAGFIKDEYLDSMKSSAGVKNGIATEQNQAGMNSFDFFDASKLSEAERASYYEKVEREKNLAENRLNSIKEDLEENEKTFHSHLGREIQNTIKDRMKKEAEKTKKRYDQDAKQSPDEYKTIPFVKYDSGSERLDASIELGVAKTTMLKHPKLYAAFGPEMDTIYARLYASARLNAELGARKRVLKQTLTEDQNRTDLMNEYATKMKDKHFDQNDMKKKYEEWKGKKVFKYKSKNKYINYISQAVEENMRSGVEKELSDIDKQLEYLRYNERICNNVIKFMSEGAKGLANKDHMKEVRNFLKAEGMGYLLEYHKIDEYNNLMNDACNKAIKKVRKEDVGGDGIRANNLITEEKLMTDSKRAEYIYKSRKHATKAEKIAIAEGLYARNLEDIIDVFKWVAGATPEELAEIDLKWDIEDGKEYSSTKAYYRSLCVYSVMNNIAKDENMKKADLYDRKVMRKLYEQCIKLGIVKESEKFISFMTRMQVSFEMISKIALKNFATYKINIDKNHALFDLDRIKDMTTEELAALEDEFTKKIEDEEKSLKEKEKSEVGKAVPIDVALERDEKLNRLKEVQTMINRYRVGVAATKDYSRIGSEAFNNLFNQRRRENRISFLKDLKFFAATNTYIDIEDMFDQNQELKQTDKTGLSQFMKELYDSRNKDPKFVPKDTSVVNAIEKATHKLMSIPVDDALFDLVDKLTLKAADQADMEIPVDTDVLAKLCNYSSIMGEFWFLSDDANENFLDKEMKDMRTVLNKPEYAKLKRMIDTRLTALEPFNKMLDNFLKAHGFKNVFGAKVEGRAKSELDDKNITEEQAYEELQKNMEEAEKEKEKLKDNINKLKNDGIEKIIANGTNELFERIYKSGEKLSINNMTAWKNKVKEMTTKGFFEKETENGKWLRIAAQSMLDNWPYSFEEFFKFRVQQDTGKALKLTIETYGGKEANHLFNLDNAGLYSEIITENEVHKYTALDEQDRKNLDRRLVANGYDPNLIKLLFKPVNINGVNMPATYADRYNRKQNKELYNMIYKGIPVFNKGLKEHQAVTGEFGDQEGLDWVGIMKDTMFDAIDFEITPEMLNEENIAKNFKRYYEKAQRFGLAKHFYEKHKAYWNSDAAKYVFIGKPQQIQLHNAFDLEGNSLYSRFYDMINAFAKMHMVDENGRFDIGLTNKEINAARVNQVENLQKMRAAYYERRELFTKARDIVGTEIRRNKIAEQIQISDRVNVTFNAIQIKSQDNTLKIVQNMDFSGNIRDINLFIQNNEMTGFINEYVRADMQIEKDEKRIKSLTSSIEKRENGLSEVLAQIEKTKAEGGDTKSLEKKKSNFEKSIAKYKADKERVEQRLEDNKKIKNDSEGAVNLYQIENMSFYSLYTTCHDKNGKLMKKTYKKNPMGGDPIELDTTSYFHEFHLNVASNMRDIYDEFKDEYKSFKKAKKNMLDRQRISDYMMFTEFPTTYRRYKQLDLYLGLLEQDSKSFEQKKDKDPFVKTFATKKKEADNKLKEFKNFDATKATELEKFEHEKAVRRKKGSDDASYMLNALFKEKDVIEALHDYMRQISAVATMHGVSADGELIEDIVAKESEGYYTDKQTKMIAHDYEDKGRELAKNIQESANTAK